MKPHSRAKISASSASDVARSLAVHRAVSLGGWTPGASSRPASCTKPFAAISQDSGFDMLLYTPSVCLNAAKHAADGVPSAEKSGPILEQIVPAPPGGANGYCCCP